MISFKHFLCEGGAAGHMAHPFDLPNVNTGKDLIKLFQNTAASLHKTPATVKIDGLNTSIKLITNQNGNKEFAMDRGSNKKEDVDGVTIATLPLRFPEGHGMLEKGAIVLNIFNNVLPSIEKELKQLGLWSNSKILLNMEFVQGTTTVIGYSNNFLAIHGLNEIIEVKSPVRGSISRASQEMRYSKSALASLIEKIQPIAKKAGFSVVNEFVVKVPKVINFMPSLNAEFAVKYDEQHGVVKTLGAWLNEVKNPRAAKIVLSSGKTIGAMSLENYKNVTGGVPLNTVVKNGDKQGIKLAIAGAIFYHATIILGQLIKSQAASDLGSLDTQEGIVVRDPKLSSNPFKITGNFITGKEMGKIQQLKAVQQAGGTEEEETGYQGLLQNMHVVNSAPYQTNTASTRAGNMGGY